MELKNNRRLFFCCSARVFSPIANEFAALRMLSLSVSIFIPYLKQSMGHNVFSVDIPNLENCMRGDMFVTDLLSGEGTPMI